jgi:hypothetical protein
MEECARETHCAVSVPATLGAGAGGQCLRRLGWDRDGVEMMSLL